MTSVPCAAQAANSQAVAGGGLAPSPTSNLHPFDPEHLIVNGLGGAFLHPTHVFAPARFASVPDPHADELFEQSLSPRGRSPRGGSPRGVSPPRGRSPSRGMSRRGSFVGAPPHPSCTLSLKNMTCRPLSLQCQHLIGGGKKYLSGAQRGNAAAVAWHRSSPQE